LARVRVVVRAAGCGRADGAAPAGAENDNNLADAHKRLGAVADLGETDRPGQTSGDIDDQPQELTGTGRKHAPQTGDEVAGPEPHQSAGLGRVAGDGGDRDLLTGAGRADGLLGGGQALGAQDDDQAVGAQVDGGAGDTVHQARGRGPGVL